MTFIIGYILPIIFWIGIGLACVVSRKVANFFSVRSYMHVAGLIILGFVPFMSFLVMGALIVVFIIDRPTPEWLILKHYK